MGRDIVAFQRRINHVAVFLDIDALAQRGVIQIGPLRHEDVLADARLALDHGIA